VIAGQLDGIVEIDYLVALLDQLSWATGFDRDAARIQGWVNCVQALVGQLSLAGKWIEDGIQKKLFTLDQVIAAARGAATSSLGDWLMMTWKTEATNASKDARKYLEEDVIGRLPL
jgi:hypothetical protein